MQFCGYSTTLTNLHIGVRSSNFVGCVADYGTCATSRQAEMWLPSSHCCTNSAFELQSGSEWICRAPVCHFAGAAVEIDLITNIGGSSLEVDGSQFSNSVALKGRPQSCSDAWVYLRSCLDLAS